MSGSQYRRRSSCLSNGPGKVCQHGFIPSRMHGDALLPTISYSDCTLRKYGRPLEEGTGEDR